MTASSNLGRSELSTLMLNTALAIPVGVARHIGLNQSVTYQMLAQYHAMKAIANPDGVLVFEDGHVYVPVTQDELTAVVGFFDIKTIAKHLAELQDRGMIKAIQPHQSEGNQTKWYTVLHPYPIVAESEPDNSEEV